MINIPVAADFGRRNSTGSEGVGLIDSHLKAWETEYTHIKWGGPYSIQPMKDYLKDGVCILDVGCGNGKLFVPLKRAGFNVIGLDLSRNALLSIASSGIVQGDARHLPFMDDTFDAVVCHDVLQHLLGAERQDTICEMRRALKPGGILFLEVFGREDMRYGGTMVEPHTFRRQSGIIYHYFTEDELKEVLSDFTLLKVDSTIAKKTFRGESFTRHKITVIARK